MFWTTPSSRSWTPRFIPAILCFAFFLDAVPSWTPNSPIAPGMTKIVVLPHIRGADAFSFPLSYGRVKEDDKKYVTIISKSRVCEGILEKFKNLENHEKKRSFANMMLYANSFLLVKGEMAFPVLISSIISFAMVMDTNEAWPFYEDWASFQSFLSLFFSGVASFNGWLLRRIEDLDVVGNDSTKKMITIKTIRENNLFLYTLLLAGSRGMELAGGMSMMVFRFLKYMY